VAGGTTTPVTKVLTGAVLSGDGRAIAFVSSRSDLVDGDTNNYLDAFLYRR
jgi:hypothetical protein